MFELASCDPPPRLVHCPATFGELVANLYKSRGYEPPELLPEPALPPTKAGTSQQCVVGFSGGKDSACVAAMAAAQGYAVTLVHVAGLNRSYSQELQLARNLAGVLCMPLRELRVRLRGRHPTDLDNRLKNQFLLCQQIDLAHGIGATAIGQGNHAGDHLDNVQPASWFTDATENYDAFRVAFPGELQYLTGLLENVSHVYATLAELRPEALPHLGSCIHPQRFVGMRRDQTRKKWGVDMLPGRCGVCYKCRWEWLILASVTDLYELQRPYAMECLDKIREKWGLFYQEHTQPADRASTLAAIVDQMYTPTPELLEWVGGGA